MAIKAGQILHSANGTVVDRIQTAGVSSLNIPQERIYELGNYQTVATIRDIPDLSFDLESFDVSTEIEALILGKDPTVSVAGTAYDFSVPMPTDIISPFRSAGAFNIVKGVITPYLSLESATYRFGTKQNATQRFTLKGDSIYYVPGSPYYSDITLIPSTLTYNYAGANTALQYVEHGVTNFVLSCCVKNPTTGVYKRLFQGTDYTSTSTVLTLLQDFTVAAQGSYTHVHVTWGSATAATYGSGVHQGTSVKPAAVRGKDIDVYVNNGSATPTHVRWAGVQSFEVTRKVNLENTEEFGNYHYVASDYDTADVTGKITVRPVDDSALFTLIRQVANVNSTTQVLGPYSSLPVSVELRVSDPDTGTRLKTIWISDARFTIPAPQGKIQTKLDVTFDFQSDGGNFIVYNGARAGSLP